MDSGHLFPANFPTITATTSVLEAQNHIAQPNFIDQSFVTSNLSHPPYDEFLKSYNFPGYSAATLIPPMPPGRRGRPLKLKPIPNKQPVPISLGSVEEGSQLELENRGQTNYQMSHQESESDRPPKSWLAPAEQGGIVPEKRGRGRPPGLKNKNVDPKGTKRGPGRPRKDPNIVVIPYAHDVIPPAASPASATNGDGGPVYSGVVKRPVGRPRKNPLLAENRTQAHDLVIASYGELKRKFDYFQAKVKGAVEVINPYLSNETAFPVLTAVQELDALASMDVTGPWKDQTQMNL